MGPFLCLLLGAGSSAVGTEPGGRGELSFVYHATFHLDHELRGPAVPYVPQPGDIFLCTGKEGWSKLGHLLAWTAAPQHTGMVVARPDGSLALLEAGPDHQLYCGVHDVVPQLRRCAEHERVWIRRRRVPLTPAQSAALTDFADAVEGRRFASFRLFLQVTPFRTRGPLRTRFVGGPHGLRDSYYCSELVAEACVAAGLLDARTTRPSATYPRDLFFGHSVNPWIDKHLDMSEWEPPARWTLSPGSEPSIAHHPWLDLDSP
jgi:hypothetical protein